MSVIVLGDLSQLPPSRSGPPYLCSDCGRDFEHLNGLKMHIRWTHSDENYKCGTCKARFISLQRFRQHKKERHLNQSEDNNTTSKKLKVDYECSKCRKKFASKVLLQSHLDLFCQELVEDKKELKCSNCLLKLTSKSDLIEHMTTHLNCHLCKFSRSKFKSLSQMREHFSECHGYVPCPWCHLIFRKKETFREHFSKDHSNLPFKERPDFTFEELIVSVLQDSRNKRLRLTQIIRQIEIRFPFYALASTSTWKDGIIKELKENPKFTTFSYHKYSEPYYRLRPTPIVEKESKKSVAIFEMCSACGTLFNDKDKFEVHKSECSEKKPDDRTQIIQVHVDEATGDDVIVIQTEEIKKENSVSLSCPFCKRLLSGVRSLLTHVFESCTSVPQEKDASLMMCQYCPTFVWDSEYHVHVAHFHGGRGQVKCKACQSVFSNNEELRTHFRSHTGLDRQCQICGVQFPDLRAHSTSSGHVTPLNVDPKICFKKLCHLCNFTCPKVYGENNDEFSLRIHMTENHAEIFCSICNIIFVNSNQRDSHLKTTTDHPACGLCLIPFESLTKLVRHFEEMSTPAGLILDHAHADLFCRQCRKVFPNPEHFCLHKKSHHHNKKDLENLDEKDEQILKKRKIKVKYSDLRQSWRDHLSIISSEECREETCSEAAKFKCQICDYLCHEENELQSHINGIKHPELTCPSCKQIFLTTFLLNEHFLEEESHIPDDVALLITMQESDIQTQNEPNRKWPLPSIPKVLIKKPLSSSLTSNEIEVMKLLMPDDEETIRLSNKKRKKRQMGSETKRVNYQCEKCDSKFTSHLELKNHARAIHPEIFDIQCPDCSKRFINRKLLIIHRDNICKKVKGKQ